MDPDKRVNLPREELPQCHVLVHVTFLEPADEATLAEPGDYLQQLEAYEQRLAKGQVQWQ